VVGYDFTSASKIYKNPSYGGVPSEAFKSFQSRYRLSDGSGAIFSQTVGARTVSPEVFGERGGRAAEAIVEMVSIAAGAGVGSSGGAIGDKIGRKVAHYLKGYPPIWTTVKLTLFADGGSKGAVVRHSLFPSMSYYAIQPVGGAYVAREHSSFKLAGPTYDVHTPEDAAKWNTDGWGSVPGSQSGPSRGNPWGRSKTDLTGRPVDSEIRTA
jgi:hypothetical protein